MRVKKGYTLIEILVAVAIFGLLIGPIYSLVSSTIKINQKAKERIEIANVFNYAYEIYLSDPSISTTTYKLNDKNYLIEYTKNITTSYSGSNILYLKDLIDISKNDEQEVILKIKKKVNEYKYICSSYLLKEFDEEEFKSEILISNTYKNLAIDFDNIPTSKKIKIKIDGVYDENGFAEETTTDNFLRIKLIGNSEEYNKNIRIERVFPNVELDQDYVEIKIKRDSKNILTKKFFINN